MDLNLLKLLLIEIKSYPFIYDKKVITYKNAKSRQNINDVFTSITANIKTKDRKYFYISGKEILIHLFKYKLKSCTFLLLHILFQFCRVFCGQNHNFGIFSFFYKYIHILIWFNKIKL